MKLDRRAIRLGALMFMAVGAAIRPSVAEAQCITPPGLVVGWWQGDGNANGSFGANNAEWRGNRIAYGAGKVGQAFDLNGASYLSTPALDLSGYSGFTLQAWIKTTNISQFYSQEIFKQQKPLNGANFVLAFTDYGQSLGFLVHAGGVAQWLSVPITPSDWADGAWHLVTATHDGQVMKVYRDDQLIASQPRNSRVDFLPPDSLYIGGGFIGTLDEPVVFGWPLSASQVAAVYNAGSAGMCLRCAPVPSGLMAWWPGDGAANSLMGSYDATLSGGVTFAGGIVNQSFAFDGVLGAAVAPRINLSTNAGLTLQAWIKPRNVSAKQSYDIFEQRPPGGQPDCRLAIEDYGRTLSFGLLAGGQYRELDIPINAVYYTNEVWHLITATYDGALMRVYKNGQLIGSLASGGVIGYQNGGAFQIGGPVTFDGSLDEAMVLSRALSAAEINQINAAGQAGVCKVRILSKPVNTLLVCGLPASLSVVATNAAFYQWQVNGADIAGATNSTYAIASARNSDAGVYTVVVRDGSGGSVRATASMGFSFLDLKRYAGLQVTAGVGASVRIEAVNDTRNPGSWQVLTNIASLPTNPYLFIDYDSVVYPNRFYRVVNQNCP